ncbi:MAG: serine/threonine protein kinase, partial [Deltaproteobacteria bacterium]|nr:serine/threonine protein kinase [Deltaproteobacteria bacterium]
MRIAERFEVLSRHDGGMASVFVCRDSEGGRLVAAKTPRAAPDWFSREARLWIGLGNHPNIVRADLVHTEDDCRFLFMEFVGELDGRPRTLSRVLEERGKMSLEQALRVGIDIARALRHARSVFPDLVHRDIKPDNIMVRDNGQSALADFGIGHVPKEVLQAWTEQGAPRVIEGTTVAAEGACGTLPYASPEQMAGCPGDLRSDLHALGMVLLECLVGRFAHDAWRTNLPSGAVPGPAVVPAFEPKTNGERALAGLIGRLIDSNPERRPSGLDEVEKALSSIAAREGAEVPEVPEHRDELTAPVWASRIHSLSVLGKPELALENIQQMQRRYPWSDEFVEIARELHVPPMDIVRRDLGSLSRVLLLGTTWLACVGVCLGLMGALEGSRL